MALNGFFVRRCRYPSFTTDWSLTGVTNTKHHILHNGHTSYTGFTVARTEYFKVEKVDHRFYKRQSFGGGGGGHSGTEGGGGGGAPAYFAEEGVFFKTSACP